MNKIIEWLSRGPKIIGEVRQHAVGDMILPGGVRTGTHVMMHIYLVNKHVDPTTIKAFSVSAKMEGKWVTGELKAIPMGFRLTDIPNVDFSAANLYDRAGLELLEYGKGVTGWIRFTFDNSVTKEAAHKADYKIIAIDAFNGKHRYFSGIREGEEGFRIIILGLVSLRPKQPTQWLAERIQNSPLPAELAASVLKCSLINS